MRTSASVVFITITLTLLLSAACTMEVSTGIGVVDDQNPPTFKLSGNGYLTRLIVFGPLPEQDVPFDDLPVVWKVFPDATGSDLPVYELRPIKYGILPDGWAQYTPKSGPAPMLIEGKLYRIVANTNSANSGYIDFTIRDGRVVTFPAKKNK